MTAVLYNFYISSCSWRIRAGLKLKGIAFEYKSINLNNREQHSEEFAALNPMRQVPCLQLDGHIFTQSLPALEYLDETRPDVNPFLSKDPVNRYQIRMLAECVNAGIQPMQSPMMLGHVIKECGGSGGIHTHAKHFIRHGLGAMEKLVQSSVGKYCVGDVVTLADLCLFPQMFNAIERYDVDANEFPTLKRVYEALLKVPAIDETHPYRQQDCPPDKKWE